MSNSVYGIGITGLLAAQAGLVTTGHNIANANTPGYHRQRIEQSSAIAQYTGSGYFGSGTQVDTVVRQYSQFLDNQLIEVNGRAAFLSTYRTEVRQLDDMLADANAGLSPALQDFFRSVQDVGANPTSTPSRQAALSAGQSLVSRFRSLETRMSEIASGVNSQIAAGIETINGYATQIAAINAQLIRARSTGTADQPPNDLLDQRDLLIADLNRHANVAVAQQNDGSLNVMIGNGQSLVVGGSVSRLVELRSPENPERSEVGFDVGGSIASISSNIENGSLGALIAFRDEVLEPSANQLGRVAIALGQTFNDQHRLGQDLNDAAGGDFFNVPAPTVHPRATNTGNAVLSATVTAVGNLTTSDYRVTFSGGSYTVLRLSDSTSQSFATLPQTVDGVRIALASGAPANGDSFLVQPTRVGARNLSLAITSGAQFAAAAPFRTAAGLSNTGSGVISSGVVNGPPPVNANLTQPVTITFTGPGTFDVTGTGTGNPTGLAYSAGGSITYNGWTVAITGAPATGDTFTIGPNASGIGDSRNALALAALQTTRTIASGTANYQSAYSQTVSLVGNKARETEVTSRAQDALVEFTKQTQQALSGVNLDEEAANLIRYQQAYQASGKMIEIASRLFEEVLRLGV